MLPCPKGKGQKAEDPAAPPYCGDAGRVFGIWFAALLVLLRESLE